MLYSELPKNRYINNTDHLFGMKLNLINIIKRRGQREKEIIYILNSCKKKRSGFYHYRKLFYDIGIFHGNRKLFQSMLFLNNRESLPYRLSRWVSFYCWIERQRVSKMWLSETGAWKLQWSATDLWLLFQLPLIPQLLTIHRLTSNTNWSNRVINDISCVWS